MKERYVIKPTIETQLRRLGHLLKGSATQEGRNEPAVGINEHLSKGNKPIFASITEVGRNELPQEIAGRVFRAQARRGVQYEDTDISKIAIEGDEKTRLTFVAPNSADKLSTEFRNCVGVVAVGKRKLNGKQISFVFHASPDEFVFSSDSQQEQVRDAVRTRLAYMKEKCQEGSIDVVLVGGNDPSTDITMLGVHNNDYRMLVKAYSSLTEEVLHFDPVVITPPLQGAGNTHIYFETASRRLFVYKDAGFPKNPHAFRATNVSEEEDIWRKRK